MSQSIQVLIPTPLRPQAGNQQSVSCNGNSVGEVLTALKETYPALGARLYKSEGELNRFINVYVNDEDIRFLHNLDTPLKAGDELSLIPAIAGG